jgi:hypothetical protein
MKSSGEYQQIVEHNLIKSGLNTTDIDRLRFLRQQRGNVDKALMSLAAHTEWIVGDEGSEMIMSKYRQEFDAAPARTGVGRREVSRGRSGSARSRPSKQQSRDHGIVIHHDRQGAEKRTQKKLRRTRWKRTCAYMTGI